MTKVVFNPYSDFLLLKNSAVKRYFEILAELNPTKKYLYSFEVDTSWDVEENTPFDDKVGVTHFVNGDDFNPISVPRDCPALIQLVEETDGRCVDYGQAVIAELPDDVEWEILSWDGGGESFEEVHEKHRKWAFDSAQKQVVCYDDRERKAEQIVEAISLIDGVTNQLKHANNLLKLNFKGGSIKKIRQSLLALAEVIKEEDTLTKM